MLTLLSDMTSNAVFKSGSSRLLLKSENSVPGPGHYKPKYPAKKISYYIGGKGAKWIDV